jgi:hypothetical protein
MPWSYLLPTITSLPIGYDCTIPIPADTLARRTTVAAGVIRVSHRVYREGEIVDEGEREIVLKGGGVEGKPPEPLVWRDRGAAWDAYSGFAEVGFRAADEREIFASKAALPFYAVYSAPGKKSFFSDNAYKYGSPPVISQIAAFGRFVDGYPVVHLDRDRDLGETITLINPYMRPVLAQLVSQDRRTLGKIKVPPLSARNLRLIELLAPGERSWFGQIQLTASNRLVTYDVKHSLRDPTLISDHEHLDPFRADPTHLPLFQALRQRVGKYIQVHRR